MTNADKTTALKTDIYKKSHSALLLCLDNKVLREVNKEDFAVGVWLKLETLYMTKSLANKLYLKKKLFTFYMDSSKKFSKHIDEFNKLIGDLANIDVDIDDEYQALMLLTSLPSSYDNFVKILLYKRESLTLEDDHLKKDYLKRNKKKSTSFVKKNAGQGSGMHSEGYDNGDLLMAVSEERFLVWIMDSGCSFHMTPRRDFLFDFKEFNGGTVLLGDNRACAIKGTRKGYTVKLQNGRVKVINGSLMVLSRTMKGNCVYSLDGWAKSGEASVGIQEKESLAQEFNNLCKESGIVRHLTVAGTPQQNGLAEKMNRTLLNKVPIYSIGEEDTYGFMIKTSGELRDIEDIRLWRLDDVKPKIIISRDMMFNESLMYKDTLKGAGDANSGKDVEFEVELQGSINLENYVLVRDRAKRTIAIPARYRDEGVGIKSLLEVTTVKLVLLVQKLLLLVLKVNAAGLQVTTTERLLLLKG
ncbi:retrovirus-related pol polyprotein from transposon TNT 1-94 [Tanacetum coccineum]